MKIWIFYILFHEDLVIELLRWWQVLTDKTVIRVEWNVIFLYLSFSNRINVGMVEAMHLNQYCDIIYKTNLASQNRSIYTLSRRRLYGFLSSFLPSPAGPTCRSSWRSFFFTPKGSGVILYLCQYPSYPKSRSLLTYSYTAYISWWGCTNRNVIILITKVIRSYFTLRELFFWHQLWIII